MDISAVDEHALASYALSTGVEAESEEHPADPHPCDDASWHSRSRRTRRDARIKAKGEYRAMLATDSCYHFMRSFDAYFDDASADIAFEQRLQNALDFEGSANLQPMRTVVRNEEEVVHSPSCSTCHIQRPCNDRAGHAHDAAAALLSADPANRSFGRSREERRISQIRTEDVISVDNELCYLGFEQFDPTTVIQSDVAYAASAEFSAGEYQKIIDSGTNVSVETERMVDRIGPSQRITITAFNGSRSSTLGTILDPIAAVKNRFGHQILIKLPREHVVKDALHALLSVSAMVALGK